MLAIIISNSLYAKPGHQLAFSILAESQYVRTFNYLF
jgi:hypothetical protein